MLMLICKHSRRVTFVVAICFLLSVLPATAANPDRPNAGKLLDDVGDHKLPPEAPGTIIIRRPQASAPVVEGPKQKISGIRITGQDIFGEDKLLALVSDALGKELSFGELQAPAARLSKYFQDQGYVMADACILPQESRDGIVEIRVLPGRYGKIEIVNHSRLSQKVAAGFFDRFKSGDYVKIAPLERAVLTLGDINGVSVQAELNPGSETGTADLVVELNDTAKVSGQIYVDNWGDRSTGRNRTGLSVRLGNLGGRGDTVGLEGTYTGSGENDYSLSYQLPVDGRGTALGVEVSHMHYSLLGAKYANQNANGQSRTLSVYENFVLSRSLDFNLSARIGYSSVKLRDRVDSTQSDSRKKTSVWTLGLSGDASDTIGGGGTNNFALTVTRGRLTMGSADAWTDDAQARTAGSYTKVNLDLGREQQITPRLSLHLAFTGQLASKNLDSSEQLGIGGADSVRAYPAGEVYCDEGYFFTGELRWSLPKPDFQLAAFYDSGKAVLNKNPWDSSANKRTLTGAGFGLIWTKSDDYKVRLDYAWKISRDPASSDTDKNGRLWLMGVKYF